MTRTDPTRSTPARTAVISDNGGWCWFQDERALIDPATGTLLLGAVASTGGADGARRGGDVDLHIVDLDRLGASGSTTTVTLHPRLESDDHDNPALWHRADGRWLAVYSRHKSDDLTRWRISEPADGTLVALMTARADDTLGPGGDREGRHGAIDHRFVRAEHSPGRSQWQVRHLALAGPQLFLHEEDYTGLGTIDPSDPDSLWISTVIDPRDGATRAHHEIFHGHTADAGESWTWTPVTAGSDQDSIRPMAVPGDPGREVLAWYRGSFRSSQDYDAEIVVRPR